MDGLLILSIAALGMSLVACAITVIVSVKPPARRWSLDLESRITDLELDNKRVREQLHKWARQSNMEVARNARAQQRDVVADAQAMLGAKPAAPTSEADAKAQLRAQLLGMTRQ